MNKSLLTKLKTFTPLVALIIIFILPLLSSLIIHKTNLSYNYGTTSKGELVQPQIAANKISSINMKPKWHLIYLMPDRCEANCEQKIKDLDAIHTLLGPQQKRVVRLNIDARAFKGKTAANEAIIIDPHGYYMMRYNANSYSLDILSDLKRLLKYSNV